MTNIPVSPPPGGFPKFGYTRQLPVDMPNHVSFERMTRLLPYTLQEREYQLFKVTPDYNRGDPYVLYDAWGNILAVWEDLPNLAEFYQF